MNMIVTNLRIDEDKYRLIRSLASEKGLSINKYLNQVLHEEIVKKPLGLKEKKKKMNGYDLLMAFSKSDNPIEPLGLSAFDEEIYE